MLKAICPMDGTVHHAGEEHAGKMLRCSKCGRAVQIGPEAVATNCRLTLPTSGPVSSAEELLSRGWPNASTVFRSLRSRPDLAWLSAALVLLTVGFLVLPSYPAKEAAHTERGEIRQHSSAEQNAASKPIGVGDEGSIANPVAPSKDFFLPGYQFAAGDLRAGRGRTMKSGTRIRPDFNIRGKGMLTLDNLGGEDAEVKVVPDPDGPAIRDLFVQQGTKVTCASLPEGTTP
jgi:hypothetical protein